jgi:hypothetical protein
LIDPRIESVKMVAHSGQRTLITSGGDVICFSFHSWLDHKEGE